MNLVSWPRRGGSGKIGADVLHAVCPRRRGYTVCNWRIPIRRTQVTHGEGDPTCKQCLRILAVRVKRAQFQERGAPGGAPEASLAAEREAALKRALKKARRGPTEEQVRAAVRKFQAEGGIIRRVEARTLIAALEGR